MKQSRQMDILEGLHQQRIDEGSSNFSSKLSSFLKDVPAQDQSFIKQALNFLYIGFGKEFGGYIEGKRPIIKDKNTYSYMTWKIQTNQSTRYEFYNLVKKYWKPLDHNPMDIEIDGTRYYCIIKGQKNEPDYVPYASSFQKNFSLDNSTIIGIHSTSYKNEKIDPNAPGDAFKIVVSVPNQSYAVMDNPNVEKSGMTYFFRCKDGTASFDSGSNRWTVDMGHGLGQEFRCLYKASRNAEKAFLDIYGQFDKSWEIRKLDNLLSKYKIPLSTSYYPGLD